MNKRGILRKIKTALNTPTYTYDAFLSHAVEDKIRFANDLARALTERDVDVWYAGKELGAGTRLEDAIREGLMQSRYGIILVSPAYLTKIWTITEFAALFFREQRNGQPVLLPVLLDITPEELAAKFPPLADVFAIRASIGVEAVADKLKNRIAELKQKDVRNRRRNGRKQVWWGLVLAAIVVALTATIISWFPRGAPSEEDLANPIEQRIASVNNLAEKTEAMTLLTTEHDPTVEVRTAYAQFSSLKSKRRHTYELNTLVTTAGSKKKVNEILQVDMDTLTPLNSFGMDSCLVHLQQSKDAAGRQIVSALFRNLQAVGYDYEDSMSGLGRHQVRVSYTHNFRLVEIRMLWPLSADDTRRCEVSIVALPPTEYFSFRTSGAGWEHEIHQ